MATTKDIQMRQRILIEYRAGNDPKQALKNIRSTDGPKFVSASKITYWYKRFQAGNTCVFNKGSYFYSDPSTSATNDQQQTSTRLLGQFKDKRLQSPLITWDGRTYLFANVQFMKRQKRPVLVDFFHGKLRPLSIKNHLPSSIQFCRIETFGEDHFLALDSWKCLKLVLFKVNFDECKIEVVSMVDINQNLLFGDLVSEGSDKFALYSLNHFVLGRLVNGQIELEQIRAYALDDFYCPKLMGNKLCGIRDYPQNNVGNKQKLEFCEFDLETLLEKKPTDVSIQLNGQKIDVQTGCYCWLSTKLFLPQQSKTNNWTVLILDTQTGLWSNTNIVVDAKITEIFVDSNEIMTLRVEEKEHLIKFYRYPIREPDTLQNLAWLAIVQASKFSNNDIYSQIIGNLPQNSELKCRLMGK